MFKSTVLVLLGCAALIALFKWLKRRKQVREAIDRIPGPGHPVLGIISEFLVPPEEIWRKFRRYASQYYPIYKYWTLHIPIVSLLCPEDIAILLSSSKHITKSATYDMLQPWLGTGLLTSTGSKCQQRRKILTHSFHFNVLQQFIPVFLEESERLVDELEGECTKSNTDILPLISQFALNSICETAMGTRLDKTDKNAREYIRAVFRVGELLIHRLMRPWLFPPGLFMFSSTYREQSRLLKILHGFTESVIKRRKVEFKEPDLPTNKNGNVSKKKRLAMLDLLISAQNNAQPIDDMGIREEVDTFMFEGHDTTTACICFTLLMLACHEDIQDKVVEELENVLGDSKRIPALQDLQNMQYLEQVIKESLRMYPSVPFIGRVAEEDFKTSTGYKIPANTLVQIHIYDLHHNPKFYPEPEHFDPDRFSPENMNKRHPFAYLPFSAGPRNCIGQKFAMLEVKTVVAAILRRFVLRPVDLPKDVPMLVHLVLKTKSGVKVKFDRRI